MTYCVFCVRLCLIFAEARVPFELVEIDRNCKQSWFREAFPEFTTPAVQGTPGGKANGEWVGNSGAILADAVEAEPRVRAAARLRGGVTLERAAGLGQTLTAALVCSRLLGTKYEHGQAMARECLVKCGVLPELDMVSIAPPAGSLSPLVPAAAFASSRVQEGERIRP